MRIVSWNVNGLRAVHRNGYWAEFHARVKADIICLQETKAEAEQLPAEVRDLKGYRAYFMSSKVRKGYSGVAMYLGQGLPEPDEIVYGIGKPHFDDEGRTIGVRWGTFLLLNVYFPNGGQGPDRLAYKMDFYDAFLAYLDAEKKRGRSVVFCGDVNTAHEEIDLARPKENEKHTGFLPEERAWIDEVITHGYMDIWRQRNPGKVAYTYWDTFTHARDRNVGWRIDYFFAARSLMQKIEACEILGEVYGSDHCPIALEVRL